MVYGVWCKVCEQSFVVLVNLENLIHLVLVHFKSQENSAWSFRGDTL